TLVRGDPPGRRQVRRRDPGSARREEGEALVVARGPAVVRGQGLRPPVRRPADGAVDPERAEEAFGRGDSLWRSQGRRRSAGGGVGRQDRRPYRRQPRRFGLKPFSMTTHATTPQEPKAITQGSIFEGLFAKSLKPTGPFLEELKKAGYDPAKPQTE